MPQVVHISDDFTSPYQPGDVLAFYGRAWSSRVIELATWGPSHVGMIANWELQDHTGTYRERPVLIESTSLCPRSCVVQGKPIRGVQAQMPDLRVEDYEGQARLYRLADHWRLDGEESDRLMDLIRGWMGKPYDFRGALWSGTRVLKYLPRMPYSDLGSVFCSELIAACLQRLGRLCVTNAGYFNPGSLVRALVKSGVYLPGVPVSCIPQS